MSQKSLDHFIDHETAAGILLLAAALFALVLNNSPWGGAYDQFLNLPVAVQVGSLHISKPFLLWINDGLMAMFFLLVGLEVKREVLDGQLSRPDQMALPGLAALGGIVVPCLLYFYFARHDDYAMRGWAIPAATDIAFALGLLSLFGKRVPAGLKVFLMSLAIVDDLAAIIIIAIFYTTTLSYVSLIVASVCVAGLFILNRYQIVRKAPYVILGIILWVAVLKSGVHATLAGVVVALFIPFAKTSKYKTGLLREMEHDLHPWVAYLILPLFAFANAGVSFDGVGINSLLASPAPMGVMAGLMVGKPVGVILFTVIGILAGWCALPKNSNWGSFVGVAFLTGVGFTMSLFITLLAFEDPTRIGDVKLAVLGASGVAGILGLVILHRFLPQKV